jgi:histidyl-tRNA synthetase
MKMTSIKKPRGTEDLLFKESNEWDIMENIIIECAKLYNYQEIRTPIFESTDLFVRSVGDTTDVVSKEMYTFNDKKKRSLSLRPEGTAGIVRAYIEHKMFGYVDQPIKAYYLGPMFRYERPQSGRQRQFNQFGIENIGPKSVEVDAETILLGLDITQRLGIKNIKVVLNSLGDKESRAEYQKALVDYFKQHEDEMCAECKKRIKRNPLRLLDCKVDQDKAYMKNVPMLSDYLNEESQQYFNDLISILDDLKVDYEIDEHLVRGLDYYTDTIFEIISLNEESGAQATLFGGGRYDGLVKELGGPEVSGVGFAMGLERMMINIKAECPDLFGETPLDVYVMPLDQASKKYAFEITSQLRQQNISCDMEYNDKSLKGMLKHAQRNQIRYAIIIGEEELQQEQIVFKDLVNNKQEKLSDDWLDIIEKRIRNNG